MAEVGRVLLARGFPSDMERERLADKLQIHFLRARNGGVETTVSVNTAEELAIITFEDDRGARSVLSRCPHVLEVDGRMYELSLSFPWQEPMYLNKVILDMSMTIDCSQLPLGEETMKTLFQKFAGLRTHFIIPQRHCSLNGPYSDIQAFVSNLVELLKDVDPLGEQHSFFGKERVRDLERGQGQLAKQEETRPGYNPKELHGLPLLYQEDQDYEILQQKDRHTLGNSGDLSEAHTHSEWLEEAHVEALSLVMEADVFAYLRTKTEEYKHILQKHKVLVVDVTSDGVTTLYFQFDAKDNTGPGAEEHMNEACKELSQLYRQVEGNLRRAQIKRSSLYLRGGHSAVFKDLQYTFPKVMLTYDETHVYIVGESSEVSQAKQILLHGAGDGQGLSLTQKKERTLVTSSPSNSYSPASESETAQSASGASKAVAPKMHSSRVERKGKVGEEYRLAARFKSSDMGLLGFSSGERGKGKEFKDFNTSTNVPALESYSGPTPPSRSFRAAAGTSVDQLKKFEFSALAATGANHTKDDILFQKMNTPSIGHTFTSGPLSTKVPNSIGSTSTLTPALKAPPSTSVNTFSGLDKHLKSSGLSASAITSSSMSPLKRSSSFTGRPEQRQETKKTGTNERTNLSARTHRDPAQSARRPRSNSLSNVKRVEVPSSNMVAGEVRVSALMWSYMKEAYRSRLDALLSGIQLSEIPADKNEVRVILKGQDVDKVGECQSELQKLVGMIHTDFYVEELQLKDLGLTKDDELLVARCSDVRSRFSKILLHVLKDTIILIGPKLLCSQASKTLKEMFPSSASNFVPQVSTFFYQRTLDQGQDHVSPNHIPFHTYTQTGPNQTRPNTASPEVYSTNQSLKHKSYQSEASSIQLPKQNIVVKEKVKGEPRELETSKTDTLLSKSSAVNMGLGGPRDDLQNPSSLTTEKRINASAATSTWANLQIRTCLCGASGEHVVHTVCGMFLCSRCLPYHAKCEKCSKVKATKEASQEEKKDKPKEVRGIHGSFKYVELTLSLPGFERHTTAKITYNISDGIQGEEHPNPGSLFQGGVFEAYLPLSPKGRGLLPGLEKAFNKGLTFTVRPVNVNGNIEGKVTWDKIPHKTKMNGGKSGHGYPDYAYLDKLSEALKKYGIEKANKVKS